MSKFQLSSPGGFGVFVSIKKVFKQINKKKHRNYRHSNLGAESTSPGASNFETFILQLNLFLI